MFTGKNRWTPEQDARLCELWAGDLSATQIGAAMGMNKNQIIGRVRRLGLPQRTAICNSALAPVSDRQRDIIRNLWLSEPVTLISRLTGLDYRRIKKLAAEMDLPLKSRGVVFRPAVRAHRELPGSDTRAASPSRPGAAINSGVSSAVKRRASSLPAENLPEAVAETPPPRVFSHKQCQFIAGDNPRDYRFCEAPCVENLRGGASPFCAEHYALCMIPPKKHEAKRKALRIADAIAGRLRHQPKSAWRA